MSNTQAKAEKAKRVVPVRTRRRNLTQYISYLVAALVVIVELGYLGGMLFFRGPGYWNRRIGITVVAQEAPKPKPKPKPKPAPTGKEQAAPAPAREEQPAPPPVEEAGEQNAPAEPKTAVAEEEPPKPVTPGEAAPREDVVAAPAEPASQPPADDVDADVAALREEMAALRQRVQQLASDDATDLVREQAVEAPVGVPEQALPPPPEDPPAPLADSDAIMEARAREMLTTARQAVSANDFARADDQLRRIQTMAPDFLPAHVERARLFERRDRLRDAKATWEKVLELSEGTPLHREATREQARLTRALRERARPARPPASTRAARPAELKQVKILSVDREKFQPSGEFEEMRLLRIALKPISSRTRIDPERLTISVVFFDKDASGAVHRSRAMPTESTVRVEGGWPAEATKTVTASYMVPTGFRGREARQYGARSRFFGYLVQVYYNGVLQDQLARPDNLVVKASS